MDAFSNGIPIRLLSGAVSFQVSESVLSAAVSRRMSGFAVQLQGG